MAIKSRPKLQTLLLVTCTAMAVGYGVAGLARQVTEAGPKIGDIVAFDPAHQMGMDSETRLVATRPGQTPCVLDLSLLRRSGGSLVLEQLSSAPTRDYLVHWAGPRTSDDAMTDCGRDTELILSRIDMSTLAASAGGFGVDPASTLRLR